MSRNFIYLYATNYQLHDYYLLRYAISATHTENAVNTRVTKHTNT